MCIRDSPCGGLCEKKPEPGAPGRYHHKQKDRQRRLAQPFPQSDPGGVPGTFPQSEKRIRSCFRGERENPSCKKHGCETPYGKRADGGRSIETGGLFRAGKLEDDKTAVFTVDSVLPQGHLPEKACYVPLYSHLLGIWLGGH